MPSRLRRAALASTLAFAACAGGGRTAPLSIVPAPASVVPGPGAFVLDGGTHIVVADAADREVARLADFWAAPVRAATGWPLPVGTEGSDALSIRVAVTGDGPAEGYRLGVTETGVTVSGSDHAGLFYGLQTLTQMLPPTLGAAAGGAGVRLAGVSIEDAPRFPYRGMHLDVGRHFFGPDFVKRYVDMLARYKVNRFHWHLTEDQGWRIEIERYPRLTEVGAWRAETMVEKNFDPYVGDGERYGGFYTKDEIRDVVAYAAERFVTIVPEIEMPGHSLAALAAYPELACTEGPFEVGTRWGVFEEIYCPREETFAFLEGVLTEVLELFPGEYVHIGGDEAPKALWEESEIAQEVIRREGLADEHELQSWFIRRIERFLNARGRRLIGWDEILEGGLAPNATVMSWRGVQGGIEAARQGHDVVMTPTSHMYFDFYQGDPEQEPLAIGGLLTLERVYDFEPVPDGLTESEAAHVLGAQGNVWTEYIPTEEHAEYMIFPRLFALSEVAWSPPEARDFEDFAARLPWHLRRLDALGVGYRIPDVLGLEEDGLTLRNRARVELASPGGGDIRYTLDGAEPTATSALYRGPLDLDVEEGPVTVAARAVLPDGRAGPIRSATFRRAELRGASLVAATMEPGVRVDLLEPRGPLRSTADLERAEIGRREPARAISIPEWAPAERFGLRVRGYVDAPRDAVYTLHLTSDDGSVVRISNLVVVDHDGRHGTSVQVGKVALAAGLHPVEVLYFQAGGGRALDLRITYEDDELGTVELGAEAIVRVQRCGGRAGRPPGAGGRSEAG